MNGDAAASFKSATYQGKYSDLNFWITMLQGGVLGCASLFCILLQAGFLCSTLE